MKRHTKITADSYNKTVKDYEKFTKNLYPKNEINYVCKLLKRGSSILDLGCGTGRDSCFFASKGFKVTGIDVSKKMIAYAKNKCKKPNFKIMDIQNIQLKEESFDLVWANASLLHAKKKDFPKILGNIRKIMKKNGIFFLKVKKGAGEKLLPDKRYNGVVKFWSFFSKKEIEDFLKSAEFKIIKSYVEKKNNSYFTNSWINIFSEKSNQ